MARDESEARKWLERVEVDAVEGKLDACHMLCELYMDGYNGVGRDPARAFKYSQMGVAQKFPWGLRRLARCYAEGLGTPKDIGKARECLHQALENCGSNQKVKSEIEAELKNLK